MSGLSAVEDRILSTMRADIDALQKKYHGASSYPSGPKERLTALIRQTGHGFVAGECIYKASEDDWATRTGAESPLSHSLNAGLPVLSGIVERVLGVDAFVVVMLGRCRVPITVVPGNAYIPDGTGQLVDWETDPDNPGIAALGLSDIWSVRGTSTTEVLVVQNTGKGVLSNTAAYTVMNVTDDAQVGSPIRGNGLLAKADDEDTSNVFGLAVYRLGDGVGMGYGNWLVALEGFVEIAAGPSGTTAWPTPIATLGAERVCYLSAAAEGKVVYVKPTGTNFVVLIGYGEYDEPVPGDPAINGFIRVRLAGPGRAQPRPQILPLELGGGGVDLTGIDPNAVLIMSPPPVMPDDPVFIDGILNTDNIGVLTQGDGDPAIWLPTTIDASTLVRNAGELAWLDADDDQVLIAVGGSLTFGAVTTAAGGTGADVALFVDHSILYTNAGVLAPVSNGSGLGFLSQTALAVPTWTYPDTNEFNVSGGTMTIRIGTKAITHTAPTGATRPFLRYDGTSTWTSFELLRYGVSGDKGHLISHDGTDYVTVDASVANSVLGVAGSSIDVPAAIHAGTNNTLLGQFSGSISFARAPYAAIVDGTANSILGRASNSSGVLADIVAGTNASVLVQNSNALSFLVAASDGQVLTRVAGALAFAAAPGATRCVYLGVITSGTSYSVPGGKTRLRFILIGPGGNGGNDGTAFGLTKFVAVTSAGAVTTQLQSIATGGSGGGGANAIVDVDVSGLSTITVAIGAAGSSDTSITVGGNTITAVRGSNASAGGTTTCGTGGTGGGVTDTNVSTALILNTVQMNGEAGHNGDFYLVGLTQKLVLGGVPPINRDPSTATRYGVGGSSDASGGTAVAALNGAILVYDMTP